MLNRNSSFSPRAGFSGPGFAGPSTPGGSCSLALGAGASHLRSRSGSSLGFSCAAAPASPPAQDAAQGTASKQRRARRRSSLGGLEALPSLSPSSPPLPSSIPTSPSQLGAFLERTALPSPKSPASGPPPLPATPPGVAPGVAEGVADKDLLLLSPSLISAGVFNTPGSAARRRSAEHGVTPENFNGFLNGVSTGVSKDVKDLWGAVTSWFKPEGPVEAVVEALNPPPASTPERRAAETGARKLKKFASTPDAALRQRMPGLWAAGMAKHTAPTNYSSSAPVSTPKIPRNKVRDTQGIIGACVADTAAGGPRSVAIPESALESIVAERSRKFEEAPPATPLDRVRGCPPPPGTPQVSGVSSPETAAPTSPLLSPSPPFPPRPPPSPPPSSAALPPPPPATPLPLRCDIGAKVSMRTLDDLYSAPSPSSVDVYWIKHDTDFSATSPACCVLLAPDLVSVVTETGAFAQGVVTWATPRGRVATLALCAEATSATIAFKDGQADKTLVFERAEDCIAFAQSFYKSKTGGKTPAKTPKRKGRSAAPSPAPEASAGPAFSVNLATPLTALSEAEREMVEAHRRGAAKGVSFATPQRAGDASSGKTAQTPIVIDDEKGAGALSAEDEAVLGKYRKMLKMNVPEGAVRNKMQQEGVEARLVALLFGDGGGAAKKPAAEGAAAKGEAAKLSSEDEKTLEKYRKMLKMHVPPPAVEHKMKSDGVSDALVAVLFPDSAKAPAAEAVEQAEAPPALTDEEEKIAGKYRKMLKMNVPAQAVNNKMAQEGVAKNIIDALFPPAAGGEEEEKKAGGGKKAAPEKLAPKAQPKGRTTGTGVALMSLHWTPLSEDAVKSSVWGKVGKAVFGGAVGGSKGGKEGEGEGEEGEKKTHDKDILHLESLFHKKSGQKKSAAAKTTTANKKQKKMAGLIDLTRANNVAIGLKAFKEFSYGDLVKVFNTLDPERKITGERLNNLSSILPTDIEQKAIANFRGKPDELLPAELFFSELKKVPRLTVKFRVLETMDTLSVTSEELKGKLDLLAGVCERVMSSEALQRILETILAIGNIMNEGTSKGAADGFTLDSLLKLTQTKSVCGKMTVLDYIVMTFAAKDNLAQLSLEDDFVKSYEASRLSISELTAEVRNTKGGLERCKAELKKMKAEAGAAPKKAGGVGKVKAEGKLAASSGLAAMFAKRAADSGGGHSPARRQAIVGAGMSLPEAPADPRAAMMAMLQKRAGGGEGEVKAPAKAPADPRAAMMAMIQKRAGGGEGGAKKEAEKKEEAEKPVDPALADTVRRLEEFIGKAEADIADLEAVSKAASGSCVDLAKYFGEGGGEQATGHVLAILSDFAKNIKSSIAAHHARAAREKKELAKQEKAAAAASSKKTPPRAARTKTPPRVRLLAPATPIAGGGDDDDDDEVVPPFARLRGVGAATPAPPPSIAKLENQKKRADEIESQVDPRANLLKMIAGRGGGAGEGSGASSHDIDAKLKLKKTGSQGQEGGDAKPKPKPTVNTLLMSPRANDMLNQAARAGGRVAAAAAGAGAGTGMVTPKGKGTGKAAGARTPLSPLASNTPRRAGSGEEPAWKVAARDVLSPSLTQPSWKY